MQPIYENRISETKSLNRILAADRSGGNLSISDISELSEEYLASYAKGSSFAKGRHFIRNQFGVKRDPSKVKICTQKSKKELKKLKVGTKTYLLIQPKIPQPKSMYSSIPKSYCAKVLYSVGPKYH